MIEFQQVAGILCPMKLMKNIRNGAMNHSKLRITDMHKQTRVPLEEWRNYEQWTLPHRR